MSDPMAQWSSIVDPALLSQRLADPFIALFDCRFSLNDPSWGRREYTLGHAKGARYVHLDEDLSGPIVPGKTGRHPLPSISAMERRLSSWGVDTSVQVVAYDDAGGAFAARLWWILQWLGHHAAAVLNGGWQAWKSAGLPIVTRDDRRAPATFSAKPRPELVMDTAQLESIRRQPNWSVVDSRAQERYRGDVEPIDPVAGRIPGAVNLPFSGNLGSDGRFLQKTELHKRFTSAELGGASRVYYCGSGVTAAHNVLAQVQSGLPFPALYAGSWSEWITDASRPIERGPGVNAAAT